jgi:hypothetical protein
MPEMEQYIAILYYYQHCAYTSQYRNLGATATQRIEKNHHIISAFTRTLVLVMLFFGFVGNLTPLQ